MTAYFFAFFIPPWPFLRLTELTRVKAAPVGLLGMQRQPIAHGSALLDDAALND
jgi:hypothetical protein